MSPPSPDMQRLASLKPLLQDIRKKLGSDWTFYRECLDRILANILRARDPTSWQEQMQQLIHGRDDIELSHSGVLFVVGETKAQIASEKARSESARKAQLPPPQEHHRFESQPTSPKTHTKMPTARDHLRMQLRMQVAHMNRRQQRRNARRPGSIQLAHPHYQQHRPRSNATSTGVVRHSNHGAPQPLSHDPTDPSHNNQHRIAQKQQQQQQSKQNQNQKQVETRAFVAPTPSPLTNPPRRQHPHPQHRTPGFPPAPKRLLRHPRHPHHPMFDSTYEASTTLQPVIVPNLSPPTSAYPGMKRVPGGQDPLLFDDSYVHRDIYTFFGRPRYGGAQHERMVRDGVVSPREGLVLRRYRVCADDGEVWRECVGGVGDGGCEVSGDMEGVSARLKLGVGDGRIPFPEPRFGESCRGA